MTTLEWFGPDALRGIRDQLAGRVEAAAARLEAEARKECPVKSGRLRDSIAHATDRDRLAASVTASAEYAAIIEGSNPFLSRAARQAAPEIGRILGGRS